ncbi:hypothetical protein LAZ67_3004622 [Cordylochernes scorpioides]|uniref:RNA-directed DNA polymerase n=1 Tax=Cordylochernes scorpioides TaxID=51811 RepID=A0ABY6KBD1_9ARAC|nr:hypothetical protein LAZ67_3004622 [Cordylochernes scorpioides]
MPRRKIRAHYEHMSEFETGRAIGLKEAGWSNRLIARHLCRSDAAIRRCWQKWVNNGRLQCQDGSGRPRATTEREDRAIVRMAVAAPESTLSTIQRVTGTQVSKMTINRRLRERNLRARRPLRCLPLTPVHRQVRLQWCWERSTWNCADWGRIVFSDESHFLLCPDDRRKRVWRRPGQRVDPGLTVEHHTGPQQGVMISLRPIASSAKKMTYSQIVIAKPWPMAEYLWPVVLTGQVFTRRKLLTGLELGDLKPTQLLRKMRTLKTDKDISEKVLQTLWMNKLPEIIKKYILVVSEEGLDKLAEIADKIQEMNPRLQVYESKNKDPTFEEMTATIASLKEEIATLNLENRTRQNRRSNSPCPRQRSRSRSSKYNPSGKYCYFHYRFGNKCRPDKCTSPCQWKKPSGKLQRVGEAATDPTAQWTNACRKSRLFVTDAKTGMRFLIDSGEDVSLIPFQGNGTPTEDIQLPCGDYRKLNSVTISDRYPIPKLEDFNHILKKTRYYSKIDLFKAYYQIPINEEDREKTAVITPRFINEVLWGLDFVFPYLDDILVASKSEEEHESHLRAVFSRLDQYGLRINQAKTVLNVNNVEFIGYWITPELIRPTDSKVQAIVDYKKPETVQDLKRFLGMLNFYRRFLKNAADDQAILNDFLKGSKKNDKRPIPWMEEAEQKFIKCKTELSKAALLTFPDPECPLALFTDASDRAMGAVLQHFIDGAWKPIAFFSKKLSKSQTKYSTYDRELLAIFSAIKHFKFFLEGRDFTIFTDQKPLIYAFQQNLEKASPRQVRQLRYISQFTTSIRHISGKDNMVADTLSRISEIISIDYDIIAEKQQDDTELSNLRGKTLWCDISTSRIRPYSYIPEEFRMNVYTSIHGLSHPGIKTTVREVTSRYIWLNINKDIRNWTKGCINCQKSKITRLTKTEYGEFGKPDERKNLLPDPIDRFTNWVEVLPLEDIKADTIIKSFYKEWISRYGTPCHLITDRGMQFMPQKLKEFAKMCGIQLKHTTSYHPQSNGKIERFHRTLKTAISSHNYIRWTERLPSVLLGLRSSIYCSSDFSIAQMVFGKTIRLPVEFFQDSQQTRDKDDLIKNL